MAHLQCIVVTPERTIVDREAEFVAMSLFDGEIGIAPGRSPMIGRLGYGELRIVGATTERFYVEGGFVQVAGNVVSVLTGRAQQAEKVDKAVAQELLLTARSMPAHTPELMAQRDRAILQARAQLRVARRND